MSQTKSLHIASFRKAEFDALCREYPLRCELLREISCRAGNKVLVSIEGLTTQIRRELGVSFVDQLYERAYSLHEGKFVSCYHQVNEILHLPKSRVTDILEVGVGAGFFQALIRLFDYNLTTLDADHRWQPDCLGDIRNIPLRTESVDVACAFEVLEHIPYGDVTSAVSEMARVARHYVYISLPCPISSVRLTMNLRFRHRFLNWLSCNLSLFRLLHTPKLPDQDEKRLRQREDKRNPHYWEVNRRSFPKGRILADIESCGLKVLKKCHNPSWPYHYFILCEKQGCQ